MLLIFLCYRIQLDIQVCHPWTKLKVSKDVDDAVTEVCVPFFRALCLTHVCESVDFIQLFLSSKASCLDIVVGYSQEGVQVVDCGLPFRKSVQLTVMCCHLMVVGDMWCR